MYDQYNFFVCSITKKELQLLRTFLHKITVFCSENIGNEKGTKACISDKSTDRSML